PYYLDLHSFPTLRSSDLCRFCDSTTTGEKAKSQNSRSFLEKTYQTNHFRECILVLLRNSLLRDFDVQPNLIGTVYGRIPDTHIYRLGDHQPYRIDRGADRFEPR